MRSGVDMKGTGGKWDCDHGTVANPFTSMNSATHVALILPLTWPYCPCHDLWYKEHMTQHSFLLPLQPNPPRETTIIIITVIKKYVAMCIPFQIGIFYLIQQTIPFILPIKSWSSLSVYSCNSACYFCVYDAGNFIMEMTQWNIQTLMSLYSNKSYSFVVCSGCGDTCIHQIIM